MDIQRLSPDEWERFQSIRLASLRDSPDAFGSTLSAAQARAEAEWRQQIAETATLVAVHNGVDIGVARGIQDATDPSTAFLISMWVAPDHRQRKVGGRLVSAVIEWARSEGFRQLSLDVSDENLAAIKLYACNGFEPTGEVGTLPPPRTHIQEHRRALML